MNGSAPTARSQASNRRAAARLRPLDILGIADRAGRAHVDPKLRRIVLAGEAVEYRLVRARRRSIGMQIGKDGLDVRAPRWVTIREIEAALLERAMWIVRALAEWRARRRDVLPREWRTGAPILYQGRDLALAVHAARAPEIAADLLNLTVLHPAAADEREVAAYVTRWLREEAARVLVPHVALLSARVTPAPPVVKLSDARSEWGSCNHRGVIRLNWRLIHLPPRLALYIVAHEVAHLVELNHSRRFWQVVETLFPGHADARRALDDWSALLDA